MLEMNTVQTAGLVNVESLSGFGANLSHDAFLTELKHQSENRFDTLFRPQDGRFSGLSFEVNNRSFALDPVAFITMAERFKISGNHTVTRSGLSHLTRNPELFEQVANHFLHSMNKPLQFRSLFDVGIAFPSKDYTKVNHFDFMSVVLDSLTTIFEQDAVTEKNFLSKELMYSFIPVPDFELPVRTFKGNDDTLFLGIECRNSEILQNGITISFKIKRSIRDEGILLANHSANVYHRHIGMTSEKALSQIQEDLLHMFTSQSIGEAINTMELLKHTMEKPVLDGERILREFAQSLKIEERDVEELIRIAKVEGDETLYGWTIGAYSYLSKHRTNNRQRQEADEKFTGNILTNRRLKEQLLSLI